MLASIKTRKAIYKQLMQLDKKGKVNDHASQDDLVLPFTPHYINQELKEFLQQSSENVFDSSIHVGFKPEEVQFTHNCKAKIFKRFNIADQEGGGDTSKRSLKSNKEEPLVSLEDIVMGNWTGSVIFQMMNSQGEEGGEDLAVEIQIKAINFNELPSRLVLIRNVNYIVEQ